MRGRADIIKTIRLQAKIGGNGGDEVKEGARKRGWALLTAVIVLGIATLFLLGARSVDAQAVAASEDTGLQVWVVLTDTLTPLTSDDNEIPFFGKTIDTVVKFDGLQVSYTAVWKTAEGKVVSDREQKDVGVYTLTIDTETSEQTYPVTIVPRKVRIDGLHLQDSEYDGTYKSANPITEEGFPTETEIIVRYYKYHEDGSRTLVDGARDVGRYRACVVPSDQTQEKNYEFVGQWQKDFTILPRTLTAVGNGTQNAVYDGTDHMPIIDVFGAVEGECPQVDAVFYDESGAIAQEMIHAGRYTMQVSVRDANYRVAIGGGSEWVVQPRSCYARFGQSYRFTYDGRPHGLSSEELIVSGLAPSDAAHAAITVLYNGDPTPPADVGQYALSVRLDRVRAEDYRLVIEEESLTILAAPYFFDNPQFALRWTLSDGVELAFIDDFDGIETDYSIDGGVTWQKNRSYALSPMREYTIAVRLAAAGNYRETIFTATVRTAFDLKAFREMTAALDAQEVSFARYADYLELERCLDYVSDAHADETDREAIARIRDAYGALRQSARVQIATARRLRAQLLGSQTQTAASVLGAIQCTTYGAFAGAICLMSAFEKRKRKTKAICAAILLSAAIALCLCACTGADYAFEALNRATVHAGIVEIVQDGVTVYRSDAAGIYDPYGIGDNADCEAALSLDRKDWKAETASADNRVRVTAFARDPDTCVGTNAQGVTLEWITDRQMRSVYRITLVYRANGFDTAIEWY